MSNPAGTYLDRIEWLQRSATKNPDNGQDEEAFTSNGYLWASLQVTTGRNQTDFGGEQTGADAEIRIRNYPAVSALDRIYSPEWDEVWIIDNIRRGDDELICDCHAYDDLTT